MPTNRFLFNYSIVVQCVESDQNAGLRAEDPKQPENIVEKRVDIVIADILDGSVVPKKLDQMSDAISRAKRDKAASDAFGRKMKIGLPLLGE